MALILRKRPIAALCALFTLVSACGGGGGEEGSPPDTQNIPPVANAGPDQSVTAGAVVTLNGSASMDANGESLHSQWSLTSVPAGSTAQLNDASAALPTFTADLPGAYVASLVVNDGKVNSTADSVSITATALNAPPSANAGSDQNVVVSVVVTLDGSATTDPDGDALQYMWTLTTFPPGSRAALSAPTSVKPTFTADVPGLYVASLVADDGKVTSVPHTVSVTASAINAAPVANAGPDQSVNTGAVITLDAGASTDANGDILQYQWSLTAVPAGSHAALSDVTAINPTFSADLSGTYVADLAVNDGKVSSSADSVRITASAANAAPTANAGPDQSVYKQARVTLDGSGSSDAEGHPLSYLWTPVSYPFFPPILSGSTTASPTFLATEGGDYVFSLKVSDGSLTSQADTIAVTVLNSAGPTPSGTELVVGSLVNVFVMREQTMTKYVDFSCSQGFSSFDQAPDGTLVAVTISQLYEINALTGACVVRGNTPEWIIPLAVSLEGQLYGVSFSQYQSPTLGTVTHRLYRLSSSGAAESYVEISGATNYVTAIDFGPDGVLYGIGIAQGGQWWIVTIDPSSGNSTLVSQISPKPDGDIDIDATGILRGVSAGSLIKFDLTTRTLLSTTPIPDFNVNGFTPIVFIP